jgi:hypothetical protein
MKAFTTIKWINALAICCTNVDSFVTYWYNTNSREATIFSRRILHAEKESLKFVANIVTTSNPIANASAAELRNFLTTNQCRDHFLSAGGTTRCNDEPITAELVKMWNDECLSHYGPNLCFHDGDAIVAGESIIEFPGLKMVNLVYSGVKLQSSTSTPFYDLLLIAEKKKVFGSPPVVWIYNKLTGHSAEIEDIIRPPSAKVQSILSIAENECGSYFNFDCKAEITVEFPKVVLKLLPASKEKMEEKGTASVKIALEKSINKAINNIDSVVNDWMNSQAR